MPWCPICKNEYVEGIKVCSDCKCGLVEHLDDLKDCEERPLVSGGQEELEKILDFLSQNHFKGLELKHNSDNDAFELYAKEEIRSEVAKAINVYLREKAKKEMVEELKEKKPLAKTYRSAAERAEEFKTSGWILLIFGIIGTVFTILLVLDIIPFMQVSLYGKIISGSVMCLLFIVFIFTGISSLKKSEKLSEDAKEENEFEKEFNHWCNENITADIIMNSLSAETNEGNLYFARIEKMKELIEKQFPDLSEGYIDAIIEKKYNDLFED